MMWKEAKYYKYNLALFISYMRNTSKVIEIILFKILFIQFFDFYLIVTYFIDKKKFVLVCVLLE